ncbi:hypothetical protein ABK040_004040 [Willaertia magna]
MNPSKRAPTTTPTLYQTLEHYLIDDYQLNETLNALDKLEQQLEQLLLNNQQQQINKSKQFRTNNDDSSKNVNDDNEKKLKQIKNLKAFYLQYKSLVETFLSQIRTNNPFLSQLSIHTDTGPNNNNKRKTLIGTIATSKEQEELEDEALEKKEEEGLMNNCLTDLHEAFHKDFVPNEILPFIRKSLLLKAKRNLKREKIRNKLKTTEELLLDYQKRNGKNKQLKLSESYLKDYIYMKLNSFQIELDENWKELSQNVEDFKIE